MTKQNFISMSLGSWLKVRLNQKGKFNLDEECPSPHDEVCEITQIINCGDHFEYEISDGNVSYGFIEEDEFDIIAIPLPDITKEIEHNGEKFVPIVELAKIAGLSPRKISEISNNKVICDNKGWRSFSEFSFNYKSFHIACFRNGNLAYMDWNVDQIKLFQKLIEWHFDIAGLIEKGEAIDINTIENPYK